MTELTQAVGCRMGYREEGRERGGHIGGCCLRSPGR